VLGLRLGPRDDWYSAESLQRLLSQRYEVLASSSRVALRLRGAALERRIPGELASEGIALGAVQVPGDGQPLVFLADHPTTGGYPVVGVVDDTALALCAQLRPGDPVRFRAAGRS
jgi:allophanate hydrolase subunit 2